LNVSDTWWEAWAPSDEPPLTLEALFRAHFGDVYRMVGHLMGPGATAPDVEDLTQQVFLAAQRGLPSFRGESKPTTWLYAIASRVVLTQLRSWRRQRRLREALAAEQLDLERSRTPEEALATRQELLRVWRCLMRIKPKKRVVYVLHEIEGVSGAQIGELLAIPEATVWTRLHHARRELSKALRRETERLG
jgi:RNA polymerase sigma-70 factor (ECF subfamily)